MATPFALSDAPTAEGPADVTVRTGSLGDGEDVIRIVGLGRLAIVADDLALIDPEAGADPRRLEMILAGGLAAAFAWRRGMAVLHAAVAARDGLAAAFAGPSGIGKSTLSMRLAERGFDILSDDLCAASLGGEQARVWRGPRRAKLWPEALTILGKTPEPLRRVSMETEKRVAPLPPGSGDGLPLIGVCLLGAADGPLTGAARFAALSDCAYDPLGVTSPAARFPALAALANRCPAGGLAAADGVDPDLAEQAFCAFADAVA